jgi:hypothetical protein
VGVFDFAVGYQGAVILSGLLASSVTEPKAGTNGIAHGVAPLKSWMVDVGIDSMHTQRIADQLALMTLSATRIIKEDPDKSKPQ